MTPRSRTLEAGETCIFPTLTVTQILFQNWRSENYKFGFRIVDFKFTFDHPHSNIRNTHV